MQTVNAAGVLDCWSSVNCGNEGNNPLTFISPITNRYVIVTPIYYRMYKKKRKVKVSVACLNSPDCTTTYLNFTSISILQHFP